MRQYSGISSGEAVLASNVVISTAPAMQNISGLGIAISPGLYQISGVTKVNSMTQGAVPFVGFSGPTTDLISLSYIQLAGSAVSTDSYIYRNYVSDFGSRTVGGTGVASFDTIQFSYEGYIRATAAGTLNPQFGLGDVLSEDIDNNPGNYLGTNALSPFPSTDFAHSGIRSHKFEPDGSALPASAKETLYDGDNIAPPNVSYQLSAWLYSPAGWASGAGVRLTAYDDIGDPIATNSSISAISAGTWTQRTTTFALTAQASTMSHEIVMNGAPGASNLLYFDDVILRRLSPTATIGAGSFMTVKTV